MSKHFEPIVNKFCETKYTTPKIPSLNFMKPNIRHLRYCI